jgi:hypothetical protein
MDLRVPTGSFFSAVGVILCLSSWFLPEARPKLSQADVNLYAGATMLIFGGMLLWLARRRN